MSMHVRARFLLTEQGSEGNGPTTTAEGSAKVPDLNAVAASLIAKHGSEPEALRVVLNENHKYRDRLRDATSRLPPEGALVLTGDDAKAYDAYRSLGKPEDLRKAVRERDEFSGKVSGYERRESIAAHALKAGVPADKLALFARLAGTAELGVETRKVNGKDVEVVTVKDGDADAVAWTEYAPFAEALPLLQAAADERPTGSPSRGGHPAMRPRPAQGNPHRALDPENPHDIKASIQASGLAAF
jgi:hypothetical protein